MAELVEEVAGELLGEEVGEVAGELLEEEVGEVVECLSHAVHALCLSQCKLLVC